MSEIHADGGPVLPSPDDVTIEQFVMDEHHPTRPPWMNKGMGYPWMIEELTGREIGSDEIRARIYGLANALKIRWNIGNDDVVCLFSPNHVDFVVATMAVHRLGGIVTSANPLSTAEDLRYQLETTNACAIIAHPDVFALALDVARATGISQGRMILFDPVPGSPHANVQDLVEFGLRENRSFTEPRFGPGEARKKLAFLAFSSGTTGKPKGIMVTHYSLVVNIVQMCQLYMRLYDDNYPQERKMLRAGSVILGNLPFCHSIGMHIILLCGIYNRCTIVVSSSFRFDRMLQSIQQYRVTFLCVVPPQIVFLCKSPIPKNYDLSSVNFIVSSAAPVSTRLMDQLVDIFPRALVGQAYGMTEAVTAVTSMQTDCESRTPGNAGILIPGIVARVVRSDGSLAGFNERGELQLQSPAMSSGYWNNPTATTEAYQDGWLRTGDEVMINEKKELFVVDRIKETIKVRGFPVAPSELEGHLLDHSDVADVCVVGIPDEFNGQLPFAFIVPSPEVRTRIKADPTLEEAKRVRKVLMKHVLDHKIAYKGLVGVEFVDSIPKNPSGKLLRRVLRDQAKEMLRNKKLTISTVCDILDRGAFI